MLTTVYFPSLYLPHFPKFSVFSNVPLKSPDSLVDMESGIRAAEKSSHGSNTVSGTGFFSSPKCPDSRGTYPGPYVAQTWAV